MTVKDLKEYKARLYGSLSRDLSEFEKNFLFISVGTLAFSITFIKDIVPIETAVQLNLLFLSWGLIAVSIGIMMFTFIRSAYASDKLWFEIDHFQNTSKLFHDADIVPADDFGALKTQTNLIFKRSKDALRVMRYIAIVFFLGGITIFSLFTGINTYRENQKTQKHNDVTITINPETKEWKMNGVRLKMQDSTLLLSR